MKQPKKLTRTQKEFICKRFKRKIDVKEWMLKTENAEEMQIINKTTGEIKIINK